MKRAFPIDSSSFNNKLGEIEEVLFERYASRVKATELPMLFILGSPRTGSTLLYQIIVNAYETFFITNFIHEYFSNWPVVGVVLNQALYPKNPISYKSNYGKTSQPWEPSEASLIFRNWFGDAHPSQVKSCDVLPNKREHLLMTMQAIHALTGKVIVTKNAWNCFRIKALAELFPQAYFLWIRRDITLSAISDLEARYRRGGPTVWNSATTSNFLEIQKRPYWEQVVEQQYEYNHSIGRDLRAFAPEKFIEVWYEELCSDVGAQMERISSFFEGRGLPLAHREVDVSRFRPASKARDLQDDYAKIARYVQEQANRLSEYRYLAEKHRKA